MRTSFLTILAGAAIAGSLALAAGAGTPAAARDGDTHTLFVQLPNGAVEQIEYTGDIAPRVVFPMMAPVASMPDPAFAQMDRIMAMMDRQAASLMQQVTDMPAWSGRMPNLPPGTSGYSVVTTFTSNGACTRSTRVTYTGGDATPQTVSNVSGDCSAVPSRGTVPAEAPTPVQPRAPHTIQVKANTQPQTYELASLR
jgi:hypothetical protein